MVTIMTILKEWRRLKDFTLKQLGEKIGVTNQTVSNWESGKSEPKVSDIPKIRKALALKDDDFIRLGEYLI